MDERYEDLIDRCIQQILAGASPGALVEAYPEHRDELLAVLTPLASLVAASVQPAAPVARTAALHRMLAGVNAASSGAPRGFLFGAFSSLSARPVALRIASGGAAVLLFAGASIGASAATGHGPSAVRSLFGGNGANRTQVRGAISSSSADSIILTSKGVQFDVRISALTKLSRNGAQIEARDLKPGDVIDVWGKVGRDHIVEARDVEAESSHGDDDSSSGATPERTTSPAASGGDGSDSGDDQRDGGSSETPESDRSHEGPGGEPTSTEHEGAETPRPSATSVPSGHGTPTATPHSGDDDSKTKTPGTED